MGDVFGRLTVVSLGKRRNKKLIATCQCECGGVKDVVTDSLRSGRTRSCGCLLAEASSKRMRTHGWSKKSEYHSWQHAADRCRNPRNKAYQNYGGRGIQFCDRWFNSFEDFLFDMGGKPSPSHSLDRIDNNGNYEPGNCRWATQLDQGRNQRTNRLLSLNGETMVLSQWEERTGIDARLIVARIDRLGWSIEKALTTKPTPRAKKDRNESHADS